MLLNVSIISLLLPVNFSCAEDLGSVLEACIKDYFVCVVACAYTNALPQRLVPTMPPCCQTPLDTITPPLTCAALCDMRTAYSIAQIVLSVFFVMDMIVNFNVGVWDSARKRCQKDRRNIASTYLFGRPIGFFWVDLIAVFPFDTIAGVVSGCKVSHQHWELLRALMLLRLMRLVRPLQLQF
jgi:hypothetical protein